jgi:hypothetical protein
MIFVVLAIGRLVSAYLLYTLVPVALSSRKAPLALTVGAVAACAGEATGENVRTAPAVTTTAAVLRMGLATPGLRTRMPLLRVINRTLRISLNREKTVTAAAGMAAPSRDSRRRAMDVRAGA